MKVNNQENYKTGLRRNVNELFRWFLLRRKLAVREDLKDEDYRMLICAVERAEFLKGNPNRPVLIDVLKSRKLLDDAEHSFFLKTLNAVEGIVFPYNTEITDYVRVYNQLLTVDLGDWPTMDEHLSRMTFHGKFNKHTRFISQFEEQYVHPLLKIVA